MRVRDGDSLCLHKMDYTVNKNYYSSFEEPTSKKCKVSTEECSPGISSHPMNCRSSTWISSIKSFVTKHFGKMAGLLSPVAPQTEMELDKFLQVVWRNGSQLDQLGVKIGEDLSNLRRFYNGKLNELKKRHEAYVKSLACFVLDTPLDKLLDLEPDAFNRAKERIKYFDNLRFDLKKQVANTAIALLPQHNTIAISTDWFESCPKAGNRSSITDQQVTNWFNRCTINIRRKKRGKGKGKRK